MSHIHSLDTVFASQLTPQLNQSYPSFPGYSCMAMNGYGLSVGLCGNMDLFICSICDLIR